MSQELEERIAWLEKERDEAFAERDRARERAKRAGKMIAHLRAAAKALLRSAPTGSEMRLMLVATNGPGMTRDDENARALYRQCDDLDTSRRAVVEALNWSK